MEYSYDEYEKRYKKFIEVYFTNIPKDDPKFTFNAGKWTGYSETIGSLILSDQEFNRFPFAFTRNFNKSDRQETLIEIYKNIKKELPLCRVDELFWFTFPNIPDLYELIGHILNMEDMTPAYSSTKISDILYFLSFGNIFHEEACDCNK